MELSAPPELEQRLQNFMQDVPRPRDGRPFFVAYSGGSDSTALLVALQALHYPVHALHVDHGWHSESPQWAEFCRQQAAALGVPCTLLRLAPGTRGEGPEDQARRGRYALLAGLLQPGDWLLTAQHQEDQAETLLLQLLRGAGVAGLAAMPRQRPLGQGQLLRPLLNVPKQVLQNYLQAKNWPYLCDPANENPRYERVRLRQQVMPSLRASGWPHAAANIARAADNLSDAQTVLEDWFKERWQQHQSAYPDIPNNALSILYLRALSPAQQRVFLRDWLTQQHVPVPTRARLAVLLNSLDGIGAGKRIQWAGGEVWLQGGLLYLCDSPVFDQDWQEGRWSMDAPLPFSGWECQCGEASPEMVRHYALAAEHATGMLYWRRRQLGEHAQIHGGQHRPLKKIMLEAGVPPHLRTHIPLLWDAAGHLLLIPGFYTAPWAIPRMGQRALCFFKNNEHDD
ncbi:MAG: tRNA lysidine(34) synthetase TilS [Acidithiobacillus sp.]